MTPIGYNGDNNQNVKSRWHAIDVYYTSDFNTRTELDWQIYSSILNKPHSIMQSLT